MATSATERSRLISPPSIMDSLQEDPASFLEWDERQVAAWMDVIGYGQYQDLIMDQGITGDTLPYLNPSSIADIGISSIGHRLAILKAIYQLKMDMTRAASGHGFGNHRPGEGMDEDEPLDDSHLDHREGDGEDQQGWEWTEDDWRPADEDPLSRMQTTTNGIVISHTLSPTSPAFAQSLGAQGMVNPPYSGIGAMIAGYEDAGPNSGLAMDNVSLNKLWDIVAEQNERIAMLEQEFRKLSAASGITTASNPRNLHSYAHEFKRSRSRDRTPQHNSHGTPSSAPVFSPSFQVEPPSNPQTSTASVPIERGVSSRLAAATPPQLTRMLSSSGIVDGSSQPVRNYSSHNQMNVGIGSLSGLLGTPSSLPSTSPSFQAQAQANALNAGSMSSLNHGHVTAEQGSTSARTSPTKADAGPSSNNSRDAGKATGSTSATAGASSSSASASATASATAAAKSFRVTLEDPCWKVLPAALKKYKINDDWRMYAMFICFGNTERCLSYDEKPLLLFQKLKESGQKPVFMLRHIRDIKSPIAIAEQKQATRKANALLQNPTENISVVTPSSSRFAATPASTSGTPTPGGTGAQNPTSVTSSTPDTLVHPDKSYTKDTRLHRPPVLQPISARAKAAAAAGALNSGKTTPGSGAQANFPDLPSPGMRGAGMGSEGLSGDEVPKAGYAIAIYPYTAEREDEFDVQVGMAFIIINKAKGWWVVQKDPEGAGNVVTDSLKSGWVPAGCLLEISQPVGPADPQFASDGKPPLVNQPILPNLIVSSSFQGIALMDYDPKGEDELALKKDELLRVFKRYAHWSYSIKQNGERGWVPSWFVGKIGPSSSASADRSAHSASSATSTVKAEEGTE